MHLEVEINGSTSENNNDPTMTKFKVYRKRWIVMTNLALINFTVATIWLSFGSVAYKSALYYNTDVATINWLSMGTLFATIIFGFLWSWLMNKMGLRSCMLISAWFCMTGAGLRICSTIESIPNELKLVFLFAGQLLVAAIQPLAAYSSPVLAAVWFPADQRSIANCVSGLANVAGVILTGILSPVFIEQQGSIQMQNMLITYSGLPLLCAIFTTAAMTTDGPPTAPSYGGTVTTSKHYLKDVKTILTNIHYVILMFAVGSGLALFAAFATLIEQVLCPWGYTETIAGVSASLLTGSGIVGAIIASLIVDKTKRFSESLKFMLIAASIATAVFAGTHKIYMGYLISLEMVAIGLLSFGISPIGMETAAEITFPVGVSISTGLVQITGQILSVLMILLLQSLGRPMEAEELTGSTCHSFNPSFNSSSETSNLITYDLTVSGYVMAAIVGFVALVFLVGFKPTYKRLNAEKTSKFTPNHIGNDCAETTMKYSDKDPRIA